MPDASKRHYRATLLRWSIALAVGIGGALLVRSFVIGMRTRAATRLVLKDFARFEGCLLGVSVATEAEASDRAIALALGNGDPLWPHACAPHLTRLEHAADVLASDSSRGRELARSVRRMQNALDEATIWTARMQQGRREPPRWISAYITLRQQVVALAAGQGMSLPPPELPRHPRRPRSHHQPAPPPRPVALPGGDEADLVDAVASRDEFAVLLRDRRSRYALCRAPTRLQEVSVTCTALEVPSMADPRGVGFVPSERGVFLGVWARAPHNLRALVDARERRVVLAVGGHPDLQRDYWVGPTHAMALQIDRHGPVLLVSDGHRTRQVPLPRSLDVLSSERALLGTPAGAALVWLDARDRFRAVLRVLSLGRDADRSDTVRVLAAWTGSRLTGIDRRLMPCHVPGYGSYFVVGDARGGTLFSTVDGVKFVRGPEVPWPVDDTLRAVCDSLGVVLARTVGNTLATMVCTRQRCTVERSLSVVGAVHLARSAGRLLVADGGGVGGTVRVRALEAERESIDVASIAGAGVAFRALRMVALDSVVMLFAAAQETYAFVSADRGAHFVPAVVAQ